MPMNPKLASILSCLALGLAAATSALAQCLPTLPAQGAAVPGPLPLFPPDNWWNLDISPAPVDPNSASFIAFINNGGTRRLHPDFGGEAAPGSVDIYGIPYAIVDGNQPKQAVTFQYWDESDGVDPATGRGLPFYPLPAQAISEPHWIEGGAPGSFDQRSQSDRHLLVIDCTSRHLYELYNVWFDAGRASWLAGSGAFFDLGASHRRPDGWTSADAAGLAIFPGLVRYDEAWNAAVTDIGHAFRVTVRATNGYVYPASHRAGSTAGALPMGARLRLKTSVAGSDPALRVSDPNVQKIFRAMQKYGLIVADNGSDMYVTGTFDTRWNNDILNPAFAKLNASDFEVIRLGWRPIVDTVFLDTLRVDSSPVVGGAAATGTVALSAPARSGGATIALSSASPAVIVPESVLVVEGATTASFGIATSASAPASATTLSATYDGVTRTVTLTVIAPAASSIAALAIAPAVVASGAYAEGTVTLARPAPAGGALVRLASSSRPLGRVPARVRVPAGATSAVFPVLTRAGKSGEMTIFAKYAEATAVATLTIRQR
jgi:hypothetical protein